MITSVYASCSALERLELWENITWVVDDCSIPWLVGGDFNVVLSDSEKLEGLAVSHMETADFSQCVNDSGLAELPFFGSLYTWWNGRIGNDSIFERLDSVFGND